LKPRAREGTVICLISLLGGSGIVTVPPPSGTSTTFVAVSTVPPGMRPVTSLRR